MQHHLNIPLCEMNNNNKKTHLKIQHYVFLTSKMQT